MRGFFGILDHLLEGPPAQGTGAANSIINIEFGQAKAMFCCVILQGLFLIFDRLFLPVG
jgi:hypothetical protein